ncbi:FAD-dependent oxidoreductase [Streptomyces lycii]|uniref:ferredoxin--NADP(+) reductase n=1 Tax=Streptomyces lycii TaxID=2654337 RepID=A0ABQ7FGW5_9ACTN|nr:FAD-dependent oxidoreductase [Streptomyces lycii]KAF4407808.1 FAD-dependent oxidoreductase [Streptomyces lycii]
MAYAITQTCCTDATCVAVCPVNCIHPTPEERAFGSTEMLYIDPKTCIDCGACADACPVDAIFPVDSLTGGRREYADINAAHFGHAVTAPGDGPAPGAGDPAGIRTEGGPAGALKGSPAGVTAGSPAETPAETPVGAPAETAVDTPAGSAGTTAVSRTADPDPRPNLHPWSGPTFDRVLPSDFRPIRVAVVGTGPAGMYAAEDLLLHTRSEVTLVDRLPVAGGLIRYGVAPDHPATKGIGDTFARFHTHPRVRMHLGLDVGKDVTAEELAAHHDAVIYAVGAAADRRLGIPGEDLAGSLSATLFVAWYNGHPEVAPDAVDLSAGRVVVVGNGNVALDVARILVSDPEALAGTEIAGHALEELRRSKVREVVLLGRRGAEHAAYTRSELLALKHLPGVDLMVDDHDPRTGAAIDAAGPGDKAELLRGVAREAVDWSLDPGAEGRRRIVFRFHSSPVEVRGDETVRAVRATGAAGEQEIPAGLALRAVGHRGVPPAGLPFDEETGTVPHEHGRVSGSPGTYVVGWIKRGPSGGIGANRTCAAETVGTLLADAVAGALPAPAGGAKAFRRLVRRRRR